MTGISSQDSERLIMISFDTNVLVYATAEVSDARVMRARELLGRATRTATGVLLLQSLAESSNVAIRQAGITPRDVRGMIGAWCTVLPTQAVDESDLMAALEGVSKHQLAFWDALLDTRNGRSTPHAYHEFSRKRTTA